MTAVTLECALVVMNITSQAASAERVSQLA
jgi:hypothetical protein